MKLRLKERKNFGLKKQGASTARGGLINFNKKQDLISYCSVVSCSSLKELHFEGSVLRDFKSKSHG